ncbi:hypothetical protein ACTMS2_06585 [Micromonospora sp. SD12]|uniref:hypothetical protein n=1 Tax=Micromonospora sp. SD12 TaxID=3452216 RepID=UPI003F8BE2E6
MRSQALVSTRTAIAGATGNAVVMGVAGVSTPLGWVLLPGLLGVSARPRVAALTGRPGGGRRTGPARVLDLPPERPD